ncbi:MAG: pectate lyase [Bacteroidetes bacterium]|nr:pectate lyase [Bacteroidota bacterium]
MCLVAQDAVANNMLLFQRNYGGWPKHYQEQKINYKKVYTDVEKATIQDESNRNDATIDNDATSKEIRYLIKAYHQTKNKKYLTASEKGIKYLLKMQYKNGGFPQFYPDLSSYRHEITYNDNAMINAMNVLYDVALRRNGFDAVDSNFIKPSKIAVAKGVDCILKTQVKVKGKLTVWCAQHDEKTLKPAKARAYELPSLSGSESVGIIKFLMRFEHQTIEIKNAVEAALEWFEKSKIVGYKYEDIPDSTLPKGRDRGIIPEAGNILWARFYDIETNQPFFSGRDGIKRKNVSEIEYERRNGYGWYGNWARDLLEKDYPVWKSKVKCQKQKVENKIVVDINGKGDFKTIQDAINSLSDSSATTRTIFIKKGIYKEKIFLEKNNVILEGEDEGKTVLTQAIARDEWRCLNVDDWGVATLNLKGSDITLKNLTIENSYGFDTDKDITISCASDTAKHEKKIRKDGHQMALRSFATTRLKVIHCKLKAFGGDTVSPWNVENGMFYFKDCVMEGGVDFYCPRGWAYAENCTFIAHIGPASIWHDGSKYEDSKTVLKHCTFKGFEGFKLGRYHRDAQFYLIDCSFAKEMADTNIYRVKTNNTIQWGDRIYYYNCHRDGGDYKWFENNLDKAKGNPIAANINAAWVFEDKWKIN